MVNLFETVKQSVPIKEAAQMYGIEVKRGGMACCPFHDDKHPSMKLNEDYFYCFGCGATGDVIELTARLYNLSPKEAAEKLVQDFGLIYDSQAPPRRNYVRQKTEAQKFKESRDHAFRVLADYFHLLKKWETDYSPKTPEETMHHRFLEAVQQKDYVGYLLDFFLEDSPEEQKLWLAKNTAEIVNLERRVNIMADKPTNRERLQEITAGIEQGIKELFESEKYMRYLSVMSKFHRYSVNNTMLIYMQRPDATLVAGFNKWKDQFERHVKKGEHGITIIAPTPYKRKIEEMKRDPDTHAPILDADGKAVMEEKEIEIPMFRPVKVFDVSQTDGKPLPELASSLSGTVPHYEAFLEAVRRSAPVPIEFEPMADNMDGYFSSDKQRIAIRPGMSEVQTVSAAVHEVAHSKLHDRQKMQETAAGDNTADQPKPKDRNTEEVEAESISYAVCQYFGIQTGANSFGYIASWSKDKDLKELKASLETINKTSCELINDMERHYKEICKERGIDLTAKQEPEQADAPQEALFLLNDATYLHIQPCDTGWDYTLYDKKTMQELDGGQLDEPELSRSAAVRQICEGLELENSSIQETPLSMIETLQDAAYQQMQEQVSQQAEDPAAPSTQLPDVQEQALDEYPMPDSKVSVSDMQEYGYLYDGILPVSKERALELDAAGLTVYVLHEDNTESMVFDAEEIMEHGGLFGVDHEEWEQSPQFHEKVLERQEHQQEREQAFLSHEGDCFAIYQVKHTDELRDIRYEGLEWLKSIGQTVQRDNYELVYTAPLQPGDLKGDTVEHLFYRFNNEHPADYQHPSMSVSDIVAIKRDGQVSCHYCDSFGFEQIPGFLPDNPLKNAEMAVEDDYGMIDGIINNGSREPTVAQLEQQARSGQPISLMDLAEAVHREEREKKKSVVEQLKSQPRMEHKQTAPKKSAEREL